MAKVSGVLEEMLIQGMPAEAMTASSLGRLRRSIGVLEVITSRTSIFEHNWIR